jgi:hypothetical protein
MNYLPTAQPARQCLSLFVFAMRAGWARDVELFE